MESPQNMSDVAIRRLTIAIWALVAIGAAGVGLSLADKIRLERAAPKSDPIVGQWLWTKPTNHEHEILPNGTLLCGGELHGTWKPLDPDKRKYELFWRNRWIDTLTLSPDGNSLVGTNNNGQVIEAKRTTFSAAAGKGSDSRRSSASRDPSEKTPEQTAAQAAVIITVNYTKDGDRYKATVSEILKNEQGSNFEYEVGDEYEPASFVPKENVRYGTGAVVFLPKNPYASGYSKVSILGTIPAFEDMTLEDFRRLVREQHADSAQTPAGATEP